jgi:hypothetical protein
MLGFVQPSEAEIREAGVEKTPNFIAIKKNLLFANLHVFCMGTHATQREMQ